MPRTIRSLSGEWFYRFDEGEWAAIQVPGCWEEASGVLDFAGPVWYRTALSRPAERAGQQSWLEFDAVSYHCEVFLDGEQIAVHTGAWDSFRVPLPHVKAARKSELLLRVEKPASLTAGPDSKSGPGNYPLRTTLAGFLPYVWGHLFGGIWQDLRLVSAGPGLIENMRVRAGADGLVRLDLRCDQPMELEIEIRDPQGQTVLHHTMVADDQARMAFQQTGTYAIQHELQVPNPRSWSPEQPDLYTISVRGPQDCCEKRFGLRDLAMQGSDIMLNGQPIYPRMALSWGWYPDVLHSNPGAERIREDFRKLKSLGYNGVKLCLWVPPEEYFALADELGMLLWLELPLWLPKVNAHLRQQLPVEYEAIVRQTCDHPALIMYSLGCELNRTVGAELLEPLYRMTKALAADVLVRDNSGSGEAYGGLLHEYAEYYDYHFYSDIHHFRHLLDHFAPRWRPVQPWVFGEFCDLDTFRHPGQGSGVRVRGSRGNAQQGPQPMPSAPIAIGAGEIPPRATGADGRAWWFSGEPAVNPQGARWQYDLPFHEQRMRKHGLWERGAELEQLSYQHALFHRKWTIETVRSYREIGGYVITGESDTPISTAGMWDDSGRLKFDAEAFRSFNDQSVLCLGWDKRRAWVDGGDRAAYWDSYSYSSGAEVRAHLILSHYGQPGPVTLRWSVALAGKEAFGGATTVTSFAIGAAEVREVALAEFVVPEIKKPQRAVLRAEWAIGEQHGQNSWELYFFPDQAWTTIAPLIYDPLGILKDLEKIAPTAVAVTGVKPKLRHSVVLITTLWTAEVAAFVRAGGRAILLQQTGGPAGPLAVEHLPFWREALRIAEPHLAWRDFPHQGWADLAFYGCATDAALSTDDWKGTQRSILRRVDLRSMAVHEYAVELQQGAGRLIVSTLRFQGGHGDQPVGIARNTAAAYLLACWVKYLGEARGD